MKKHRRETEHWKLGRAIEVDAGQVWRENLAGEEHRSTSKQEKGLDSRQRQEVGR